MLILTSVQGILHAGHRTYCSLRQVLKADLHLADVDESCWSAHVSKSFSGMRNEEVFKQNLLSASEVPMQDFFRGFEIQTAEGLEGGGRPKSPR
eukprot:327780-Pelagomonas_calceolata.AAC.1